MQSLKHLFIVLVIFSVCSCNTKKSYPPATDGLNAGLEFIGACLKGDFDKAEFYMLPDEKNKQLLNEAKAAYLSYTKEKKTQLREASLQNINIENLSTKEIIIHYNNSFTNSIGKLKVLQNNNIWLVDLKYKFDPNL